ncbi:MAG: DUF294 nucleotidyltransferase-like domain-containing protein [Bacteroidales bacterium]
MPHKSLYKFFISIVLPSMLAILFFIITYFIIIIPQFEKNLMKAKKETIKELTQSAWSVLKEYHQNYTDSLITLSEAQKKAARQIEQMRYGKTNKDYFWIINREPVMIMHPYRPELIKQNLSDYKDSHGNKLFVEAVDIVQENGEGFINYYWQWKDDTTRTVPKLSYVKGFEPWEWIIGTGIYLEDVKAEIAQLKKRLFLISAGIVLLLILTWIYVIRQSLKIEYKRRSAEQNLRLSRKKYKSLVEASNDGTLMIVGNRIIYHNFKFKKLLGKTDIDNAQLQFDDLFNVKWKDIKASLPDVDKSYSIETQIMSGKHATKDVVLSVSKVDYAGEDGFIVIVKDVTTDKQMGRESHDLAQELQTPLLLMSQPISGYMNPHLTVSIESKVMEAASVMKKYNQQVIFITANDRIVGVINQADIQKRLVAENMKITSPVTDIMTAPVVSIESTAPLFEAVIKTWRHNVSHLLVIGSNNEPMGVVGKNQLLDFQQHSVGYLVKEVYASETIDNLAHLHKRIPVLIDALLQSGSKPSNITHVNTFIADAIHQRVIELTHESMGKPPVDFCFMVMGSQGRMEETLYTDQDNAIIFEDSENMESAKEYFHRFASKVNEDLHIIGYNRCPGEIMAVNPQWCQPLSIWKQYFTEWTQSPEPQNVLDSSIFFDFRCVYGNPDLTHNLKAHLQKLTPQNGLFFYHMVESLNRFKPSVESETIDLKKIIFPLVSGIRIYGLFFKVNATNTLSRLAQLAAHTDSNLDTKELQYIYNFLMFKRLEIQARAIMNHEPPDNMLDLSSLTSAEQHLLKHAVSKINEFMYGLNMEFVK